MSAHGPALPRREPVSHIVAGFLAAAAIFGAAVALVSHPGRIGTGAMLVSLVAAGLAGDGRERRLAAASVAISTICWFAGMVIAVVLERDIF